MNYKTFTKPLIKWYQENHRPLIFRETKNPYHIWISEIMAQQTQIAQMLPYYEAWTKKWPTIESLALASEQEVLKMWEGLGYYSRAKNIYKAAKWIIEENNNEFPNTIQDIQKLPGIGDYTANAIGSIALGLKGIAVDGNVIRVMSRVLADDRDFLKTKNKNELKEMLFNLIQEADPSDFTQALMELGALVCSPTNPKCNECPLNKICVAYKKESISKYPYKKPKKVSPSFHYDVYILIHDNKILVSRDDSDGLMKGFYRLPQLKKSSNDLPRLTTTHVFSHKKWIMDVYEVDVFKGQKNPLYQWVTLEQLEQLPMITAHRAILTSLGHLK